LQKNPDFTEEEARALYHQVQGRDYNPPRRERILEWQKQQEFPICPNPDDPDACNVYKDLEFPDSVYEHITDYHEQKANDYPRPACGRDVPRTGSTGRLPLVTCNPVGSGSRVPWQVWRPMAVAMPPVPRLQRVSIEPLPNLMAVHGRSVDPMC